MHSALPVTRLPIRLSGDARRVIALPFGLGNESRVREVFDRIDRFSDAEIERELGHVTKRFAHRHRDIEELFEQHYKLAAGRAGRDGEASRRRRLLGGAYFTMEYSLAGAALFNPSIVPHPDPAGAPSGGRRIVISLRAMGEGHVSSVVFMTGTIDSRYELTLDPLGRFSARTDIAPDQSYLKWLFARKLREMHADGHNIEIILGRLPERFTLAQLEVALGELRTTAAGDPRFEEAVQSVLWLARSNYHLQLEESASISDLILFPNSANEAHGMEDLRLVRFVDEDNSARYFGTYTASNGQYAMPMLMETEDFRRIEMHTLNGECVKDKGMALFPRRVKGHYCMCSRIDGRNLFIMVSDHVHFWESATLLAEPKYSWELQLIGNCGSPLETPAGWLLLTHGVGPMRRYCIGAMLLDLDDPLRIIGRLKEPLLSPRSREREGYVPNVVYSCGSMIHRDRLYLPYAMSDEATSVATVPLEDLIRRLLADGA